MNQLHMSVTIIRNLCTGCRCPPRGGTHNPSTCRSNMGTPSFYDYIKWCTRIPTTSWHLQSCLPSGPQQLRIPAQCQNKSKSVCVHRFSRTLNSLNRLKLWIVWTLWIVWSFESFELFESFEAYAWTLNSLNRLKHSGSFNEANILVSLSCTDSPTYVYDVVMPAMYACACAGRLHCLHYLYVRTKHAGAGFTDVCVTAKWALNDLNICKHDN